MFALVALSMAQMPFPNGTCIEVITASPECDFKGKKFCGSTEMLADLSYVNQEYLAEKKIDQDACIKTYDDCMKGEIPAGWINETCFYQCDVSKKADCEKHWTLEAYCSEGADTSDGNEDECKQGNPDTCDGMEDNVYSCSTDADCDIKICKSAICPDWCYEADSEGCNEMITMFEDYVGYSIALDNKDCYAAGIRSAVASFVAVIALLGLFLQSYIQPSSASVRR